MWRKIAILMAAATSTAAIAGTGVSNAQTMALGSADVGVAPAVATVSGEYGKPVTLRATVTNYGPADAQRVKVRYLLPPGFVVVSGTVLKTATHRWIACTMQPILEDGQYVDATGLDKGPFFARNLVTCDIGFLASGVYSPKNNTRVIEIVATPMFEGTNVLGLLGVGASNPDPKIATNNHAHITASATY